jgi:hypothetical protein
MVIAVNVVLAWGAVVWLAPLVNVSPALHRLALFGHLTALVVGFGAVLTIDWFGLLLITGRRSLAVALHTARGAQALVWLGLIGLLITGVLLEPDIASQTVMVKLLAVLVVALNGVYLDGLTHRVPAQTDSLPRSMYVRIGASLLISQIGWWTATVIGYINTTH